MSGNTTGNDLEARIIEAAKDLFIEKGFAETSMSEIASRVGINRPGLHYYFRTKDKMFQAVCGMIGQAILPKVQDILSQRDIPLAQRIESIVDTYYTTFHKSPYLPLFILKEMQRDIGHLLDTINSSPAKESLDKLIASLQDEMRQGKLRTVPLRIVFLTFYGLMATPFLTRNFSTRLLLGENESFEDMLAEWKPYIVMQMENLLEVK